jgi:DNA-binding CsgD family transcriptional regulator/tetratricopeptide (TPR) repeat protein
MGSLDGMRLIGRDDESARLYDAMATAAQGQPQVVLVVGDAGIGKTSLISDLALRAADLGFATATGHCLDIEAAMSFAPVIEATRAWLFSDDEDLDDRPHARRMRGLLDPDAPEPDRVRMLDDLRLTILEAAAHRPLLLMLEDLHWADRSTQELVSALTRTARGRLLLVLTVRSDELHRRHPFRAALAELSRLEIAERIDLGPLDRDDVATLVRERSGVGGSADTVTSVHERSEGNPLYAEELIDADRDAVPEHLSDLLLARVAKLSRESRSLVRAASVDGSRLDTELLAKVTGREPDMLEKLLHEAIDDNVLRQRGGVLGFRHGLLREAVYDDLLPGERSRTHAAFAEALQERVDRAIEAPLSQLSRLAFHWSQAHDPSRTLAASVRAGLVALHVGAAESVTHLDRAVALWDRVPDPEERTGHAKPDLLLLLGQAHLDNERRDLFEALTREAVAELGPDTDRLVASRVYATFAHCPPTGEDHPNEEEAIRLALEYAGATPSPELARAIGSQSSYHHRRGNCTRALEAAEQAARVARRAQDAEREVEALHFSAIELELLGRLADAVTCQREAIRTARNAGRLGHALFETSNLAWFQLVGGSGVQAYETGVAGLEGGLANALPTLAVFCGEQAFACLVWQGRFDDAGRLAKRLNDLDVEAHYDWRDELQQELGIARGDPNAIAKSVDGAPRFAESGYHHGGDEFEVDQRVTGLLTLDRLADAGDLAESYLSFVECGDSPVRHASAAYTAYRAASAPRPDARDDLIAHAGEALDWARSRLTDQWRTSVHGLRFCMAEGYRARFGGKSAVEVLREAVAIGKGLGAFVELEPRLLLAEEFLGGGERDEGRELLTAVWADARAMGAGDHERRAFRLATRTRVPLPHDAESSGPLARLTPREREVLDLLAEGATNRAISEALFIAEKTASVHVSNVIAKLGVANRGGAAALARRHT